MVTEFLPKDYLILLKEDIPNGTEDLINTSKTLEDVADHCLLTYDRSLEQTVNYTAQALGSVAYKINLLATNFLEVLDKQNIKLNELQTKVNHLNMQVHIHQEKTARLSIGKYTMPRDPNVLRVVKGIEPLTEIQGKYKRKEIDFSVLDNVGHGMKEPQLGTSGVFSNTSRRSSTSGSDTHSSSHVYTHSTIGGSLSSKVAPDYLKLGKAQTIGRTGGLNINNPSNTIYRAPASLTQRSQIPMPSPNLNSGNGMAPPPQAPNYGNTIQYQQQISQGTRRSSSTSTSTSGSTQMQQQKQYQAPANLVSPHKMSVGPIQGNTPPYGYSGMNHPMAHIPPPPPPVVSNQQEQNVSPMMRYNELPPPPLEPPNPYLQQSQQNMNILPPPPNVDQFQRPPNNNEQFQRPPSNEQDTVDRNQGRYISDAAGIAHLQPNPYDVLRVKSQADDGWAPNQYICKVITLYEYQQNKDDELSFQEGELIYVVKKNNDGWWEGVMNGRTGLFPGNYVQNTN